MTDNIDGAGVVTPGRIREQLRYWHYTIHQIDDTLDTGLIEGKGRQLVYQALNARNLTVFAGSGLSAAYGRPNWDEWQREHLRIIGENSKAFVKVASASLEWFQKLREALAFDPRKRRPEASNLFKLHQKENQQKRYAVDRWLGAMKRRVELALDHVERLVTTLEHCKAKEGAFAGGEGQPVLFEIARQLNDAVENYSSIYLAPSTATDIEAGTEREGLASDPAWPGANVTFNPGSVPIEAEKVRELLEAGSADLFSNEQYKTYVSALAAFRHAMRRPLSRDSLHEQARRLLGTECAHALMILRRGILRGKAPGDNGVDATALTFFEKLEGSFTFPELHDLRRALPGIRERPESYAVLAPFKNNFLVELLGEVKSTRENGSTPEEWDKLLETIFEEFNAPQRPGKSDKFVTPTLRFLVGALLCVHPDPVGKMSRRLKPIEPKDFTSRRSIIDATLDPLDRTVGRLGIWRYVTTNYDFEIERYFMDRGFRRFPRHEPTQPRRGVAEPDTGDFRSDGIGGVLRDQSFRRDRAGDLIAFGIGDPRDVAAVFHLHGRVGLDDPIVITERDYMDLYLRQDGWRETVDDGIAMTFSNSPLLFLGLGMTEGDLLRPLRQFMSNRDRTLGYQAIALLPAEKPVEERTKFASSLYLRYGVHTIFYGGGEIELEAGEGERTRNLDWLHRIMALIAALSQHVKDLEGQIEFGSNTASVDTEQFLSKIMKAVGAVGEDLGYFKETNRNLSQPSALLVLFGSEEFRMEDSKRALQYLMSQRPALRGCVFTPVRRSEDNKASRHFSEGAFVDGAPYLAFPIKLLDDLFQILLRRNKNWTLVDAAELAAFRIILDGLRGAFLTGALNAALDGLRQGWEEWWRNWQESPPERVARFELPDFGSCSDSLPVCYRRHPPDNVLGPRDATWSKPCFNPTLATDGRLKPEDGVGLRSFDTFIAAIVGNLQRATAATHALVDTGRLTFTVLAHRGQGKGSFVSAFSSARGLSLYEAVHRRSSIAEESAFLLAAIFVNFGFATEIASTYDMLLDALFNATATLEALPAGSRQELATKLRERSNDRNGNKLQLEPDSWPGQRSRMEQLKDIMRRFAAASNKRKKEDGRPRILLCFSAMEVLYQTDGRPKNDEIRAWLDWLTGPDLAAAPFDLVFIGSESGLGRPFSGSGRSGLARVGLDQPEVALDVREYIEARLRAGRVRRDVELESEQIGALLSGLTVGPPPLTLMRSNVSFVHIVRPFKALNLLLDNFKVLAAGLRLIAISPRIPELLKIFADSVKKAAKSSNDSLDKLWLEEKLPTAADIEKVRATVWQEIDTSLQVAGFDFDTVIESLLSAERNWEGAREWTLKEQEWWRNVRQRLGDNRYLLTILLAAAEHQVICADRADEGARQARRFITATVDRVRNAGADETEETVLAAVLESYQAFHRIGDAEADTELHQIVLRHLGVIGAPVEVDVLVRLPEFRDYFDRLNIELPTSRRRFLARALSSMTARGLVFRLSPHPRRIEIEKDSPNTDWPVREKHRYALHRIVQRHAVKRLGVGALDSIAAGSFAPTLYASMPSPGAGLSQEGFGFVRALMIGLSQYPDIPRNDDRLRPWIFTTKDVNTRVQALRSALTLARSTLSLPVFAANDSYEARGSSPPKRGFLDTYKVRLRWILRCAWEAEEASKNDDGGSKPHLDALYRDETVWLYNELGVVALAQGNLTESLGFLRQARELNEKIEGRMRHGPIDARIELNYAIVQLERGRLPSSERHLRRILESAGQDEVLKLLARGYLATAAHVQGRFNGIAEEFEKVNRCLEELGEKRALALMTLFQARFVAMDDPERGRRLAEKAQAIAESGSQQDIWQRAELGRLGIDLAHFAGKTDPASRARRLVAVEAYGQRMGAWNLQVDALRLRADQLLSFGETAAAGDLLVRAMSMSYRNRMVLRLNSALTRYAQALFMRRDTHAALDLAKISLRMAKTHHYGLEETRALRQVAEIESDMEIGGLSASLLPL